MKAGLRVAALTILAHGVDRSTDRKGVGPQTTEAATALKKPPIVRR
jgi:hypothetical protein